MADKKRRLPPVPKFESSSEDKTTLLSKVDEFFSSLGAPSPPKESDKKKLDLSNINEKLATMLNSKKDLISKMRATTAPDRDRDKGEARRVDPELEYDPAYPNSYERVRAFYPPKRASREPARPPPEPVVEEAGEAEVAEEVGLSETEEKALRMMQKCGYRVGEGLGKHRQGITTPLTIRKTTESSCIIAPSSIPLHELIRPEVSARTALEAFGVQPGRVVVLNNMVTIKELDEETEREIREECAKYGRVVNWIVYLLGGELRIFIEYESSEQAFAAFVRLNERLYNGTLISVRFYREADFARFKLDEPLHQHLSF